ncbi:MAG: TfoX/Sxy family protein [Alphaproteobacteria bacterium]|nr:TfoX/Sxy family protein [Alphaproteobacteria bacterium]
MIEGIGPKSNAMLARAGITTRDQLVKLGAVRAFLAVKATGAAPSLNLLWGLDAVISGQHWQEVAKHSRTALLMELEERAQEKR